MLASTFVMNDLHIVAPELFICGSAFALLMIDLFLSPQRRGLIHLIAILILLAAAVITWSNISSAQVFAFSNSFVRDIASDVLKMALYLVTAFCLIYAKPYLQDRDLFKGEFYSLALFSVLGMMLMISASSMVTLYLGLEMLALSSYGLVAMDRDNGVASEAAMKYFILGALASGLLLYGMSMIYGATATLQLQEIYSASSITQSPNMLLLGVVFVVVGIAFKFGAAPFHMWLPDVYQGSPTAVTLLIAAAPKLAAFGMAYRLLESGVGSMDGYWRDMLAYLAAASLVIGNLMALVQTNFKRLLAYSTISHVGFMLMGFSNASNTGYSATAFYVISYSIMAAASFAAIISLSRRGFESDQVADFRGLWQRNPMHALLILFIMASLAGLPPFLGFWAKLEVLKAAVAGGYTWLAITGVVAAVVGAFYYLRIIRAMFFEEVQGDGPVLHGDSHLRFAFTINTVALLLLGIFAEPIMHWCRLAFPV
jgi:NADH-quinone oxidoreductase subunit N